MESPDRTENIPPPVDQGSPFFKYLCNLSPIKSTRPRHVVQTYAELSMPPPPAVFTSPPNPNKCGGRVRRGLVANGALGHTAWSVDKENLPNISYVSRSYVGAQGDTGHTASHDTSVFVTHQATNVKLELSEKQEDTSKYEYGDVSDYLTEPVEGVLYNVAKSYSYMVKPSSACEGYEYQDGDNNVASQEEQSTSRPSNHGDISADASLDIPANTSGALGVSENAQYHSRDFSTRETGEDLDSGTTASGGDERNVDGSNSRVSNEETLQLDQETAAMAFLLVGDVDSEGGSVGEWSAASQSSLPEFARQQSPDFSGIERISDVNQLRTREEVDAIGSSSLTGNRLTAPDTRDTNVEERKDALVGGALAQRGVRRRCLDFETARRKSLGGGASRKPLGLRSKHVGGTSEATISRNIPPSILCERAVATSDATSSSPMSSTGEPHTDTPVQHGHISTNSSVKSPGLLRLSRISYQRNVELPGSERMVVEATRTVRESVNLTAPSRIGLHLNSLTGSISFSPNNRDAKQNLCLGSVTKGAVASLLGIPGLSGTPIEVRCENFTNSVSGIGAAQKTFGLSTSASHFNTNVSVSFMDRTRMTQRDSTPMADMTREIVTASDPLSSAVGGRQPLDSNRSSGADVLDKKICSIGRKRLLHHDVLQQSNLDYAEEYESPRSPKKRRKSPTANGEKSGEGCKRCNCKKSKCLKLYCECFAAGTYCVGSCTCHDCFNKPEHEETVLATRQQIESRNPLAFAPKIIHAADASPKRGEEIIDTPASARHKRGCNCKKSLCLKKYCECYQAGVGCSEGCRCEGCKNMYGRKEANEEADEKDILLEALEKESQEEHDDLPKPGCQDGEVKLEGHNGKDLSPITPSVQYTGQGRTIGRARSIGKKRSSSPLPQSRCHLLQRSQMESLQSPMTICPDSNLVTQQNPEFPLTKNERSPNTTPKFTRISQLSPRWERLGDICTLTPLPQPPLRPTPASISTLDRTGASPCFNRQSMEAVSSYQSDMADFTALGKPSSFQLPDDSPPSPSNGRNSQSSNRQTPCTPCLSSSAFPGKEDMKFCDNRSSQFSSFSQDDDDTPDFLRYSEDTHSPLIRKTSSPKQKRVSPPHFEGLREKCRGENRSSFDSPARSSPGLRSGRKFILTSLPSLPPIASLIGPTVQGHIGNNQKKG